MSDDGAADPRLLAALQVHDATPSASTRAEVLAALAGARVFAAVRAEAAATHVTPGGLRADSGAAMSLLTLSSGFLPLFPAVGDVASWRAEARPVAVPAGEACAAAVERGEGVVLLPSGVSLVPSECSALARGWVPIPGSPLAARRTTLALAMPSAPPAAELVTALGQALQGEQVSSARLLEGPDGLVLAVDPPHAPAELAALAQRVAQRLGPALPVDGLDVATLPRGAPAGVPVPVARPRRWGRRRPS